MKENHKNFKLILVDPNLYLCEEWKKAFIQFAEVSLMNDYFENLPEFDCMVSAANSFGIMDGGVDLAIRRFFGMKIQGNVQKIIKEEYYGEQPVGTSFIVETGHEKHPFLAHTPTMRVPMKITRTDNVYNAMFAMLRAVANHNKKCEPANRINTVACSGFGTATGKVPAKEAARQMALAYEHFNNPVLPSWFYVFDRQNKIIFGGDLFT